MSIKALLWAWEQRGLLPAVKLTLLTLADHADHTGICWPGLNGVSERNEVSHRTTQRHIAELGLKSLLKVIPRKRDDGSQTSNLYILQLPGAPELSTMDDAHVLGGMAPMSSPRTCMSPLEPP